MATVEEIQSAYDANAKKTTAPETSAGDTGGTVGGNTSSLTSPAYSTARTDAINQMYDAQAAAKQQELKAAYDRQMSSAQAAADKIPQTYQQQANALATQYERNRRNLNLQAAGNGINTGAASQQALALNSALFLAVFSLLAEPIPISRSFSLFGCSYSSCNRLFFFKIPYSLSKLDAPLAPYIGC